MSSIYPDENGQGLHFDEIPSTALRCTISYNKYGGYCVPMSSRHRPAAVKILANEVYEPGTLEFMRSNCGDGDVVHAGTYFGDFLPALSSACGPSAKVWAFEPNPENFLCAEITVLLNGIRNVELANAGLGKRKEMLLVKTCDATGRSLGGASHIVNSGGLSTSSVGVEPVEMLSIDCAVEPGRNVSIIQLDVEGHEQEALCGALATINRCLPILMLEVWPNSNLLESDWFAHNISSLGYRISGKIHGNSVFRCDKE